MARDRRLENARGKRTGWGRSRRQTARGVRHGVGEEIERSEGLCRGTVV